LGAAVIHFGAWVWGSKYPQRYLDRLQAGVARNVTKPHRFHIWSPPIEDAHLTRIPGCFARLRTFDPEWQKAQGIEEGDRIVCLDLDLVITGNLDGLFGRPFGFSILQGVNATNPCPYNGSVWSLHPGFRPDVWTDFTPEAAAKVPFYSFPDDQAWFAAKMPNADKIGPPDGIYAFKKPGWPTGTDLPPNARIVAFPGHRDPSQFTWIPWVSQHWRT
jgi:hypothetical protein